MRLSPLPSSSLVLSLGLTGAWSSLARALPQGGGNEFNIESNTTLDGRKGPLTISWTAKTPGTVTLWLIKGPVNKQLDQFIIANAVPNSGSYKWQIPAERLPSLQPSERYGFKIVSDTTKQTTFSVPFDLLAPSGAAATAAKPTGPSSSPPSPAPSPPAPSPPPPSSAPPPPASAPAPATVSAPPPPAVPAPSSSGNITSTTAWQPDATANVTWPRPTLASTSARSSLRGGSLPGQGGGGGGVKTGVMVGAVVGGAAGLALIVIGTMLIVRRIRNKKMNGDVGEDRDSSDDEMRDIAEGKWRDR